MPFASIGRTAFMISCGLATLYGCAQNPPSASSALAPREVPAKTIPVPNTVSPEMQQIIAQPLRTAWDTPPSTPEGWKQLAESTRAGAAPNVEAMRAAPERARRARHHRRREGLHRDARARSTRRNANRTLVQIHGGCYVLNPAEAALPEAMLICRHRRLPRDRGRLPHAAGSVFPGRTRRFDGRVQGRDRQDPILSASA
jgi:monoterpene epsilon-lactone hydrolase